MHSNIHTLLEGLINMFYVIISIFKKEDWKLVQLFGPVVC